jgi:hypothetical protein
MDNDGIASKIARKAGTNLTAKARADLAEIDKIEKSLKGISDGFGLNKRR